MVFLGKPEFVAPEQAQIHQIGFVRRDDDLPAIAFAGVEEELDEFT